MTFYSTCRDAAPQSPPRSLTCSRCLSPPGPTEAELAADPPVLSDQVEDKSLLSIMYAYSTSTHDQHVIPQQEAHQLGIFGPGSNIVLPWIRATIFSVPHHCMTHFLSIRHRESVLSSLSEVLVHAIKYSKACCLPSCHPDQIAFVHPRQTRGDGSLDRVCFSSHSHTTILIAAIYELE